MKKSQEVNGGHREVHRSQGGVRESRGTLGSESRGRPNGSQGVKGDLSDIPGGQGKR